MVSSTSTRFDGWVAYMVFSAVSIGALVDVTGAGDRNWRQQFFLSAACISGGIATLFVLAHFPKSLHKKVIGTPVEAGAAFVTLVIWAIAIAAVQNPGNNLATSVTDGSTESIVLANIYFFSWATFIAAIYVTASATQRAMSVKSNIATTLHPGFPKWLMLLAVSVVVLGASSQFKKNACPEFGGSKQCKRVKYSVSLGVVIAFFSIVMCAMTMKKDANTTVQAGVALLSTLMYGVGVALVTGSEGPGATVGNLYFFTWGGFVLSVILLTNSVTSFMTDRKEGAFGDTVGTEEKKDPEIADDGTPAATQDVVTP